MSYHVVVKLPPLPPLPETGTGRCVMCNGTAAGVAAGTPLCHACYEHDYYGHDPLDPLPTAEAPNMDPPR